MKIWLLRHGRTTYNDQRRYQGQLDIPLSSEGEAELIASEQCPALVFVSPLLRARQTASRIFPEARQETISDFAEMDFGDFDGRTAQEMEHDAAYRAWVDGDCLGQCPNGESRAQFCLRTCAAFERLMTDVNNRQGEILVIVAHGGTARSLMERFALPEKGYYEWLPDNGCGWELAFDEELWRQRRKLRLLGKLSFRRGEAAC